MIKNVLLRSWLVSLVGYLLYWLGNQIPTPFLPSDWDQLVRNSHALNTNISSFFQFGIMPLISGFFLLEIFSFFLKPFKTWRSRGVEGRERLNKAALILSLIIVSIQAYGHIQFMRNVPYVEGIAALNHISLLQEMVVITFYWVGTIAIYMLGRWMTKYGVANGFSFIIMVDVLFTLFRTITSHITNAMGSNQKYYTPGLVFLALAIYMLWLLLLKQRRLSSIEYKNTPIHYQFSVLPQGLLGHIWTLNLILLPFSLQDIYEFTIYKYDSWPYLMTYVVLAPFVSYFAFYVAYSPRRIKNNVSQIKVNDSFVADSKKYLWYSVTVVTAFAFLLLLPRPFEASGKFLAEVLTLNQILLLYFIGLDILRHSRFLSKNPDAVSILTLDNIHLAEAQRAFLQAHNIESHLQGQQFRNLYAFTNPIYKIQLVVDQKDSAKAQQLLQLDEIKVV